MLHLHGAAGKKDHRSLQEIPSHDWHIISNFLINYRGGVSLEVFSREDLTTSLERMSALLPLPKDDRIDESGRPALIGSGTAAGNPVRRA